MSQLLAQTSADFGTGFKPPSTAFSQGSAGSAGAALSNAEKALSNLIGFFTILGGLFFVFYFVTGALNWIFAAGDKGKIQKARDQMSQSAIGLVIVIVSYAVVGLIGSLVGLDVLRPADQVRSIIP